MASTPNSSPGGPRPAADPAGPSGRAERQLHHRSLDHPDETRPLGHGTGSYVEIAGLVVGRAVLEPGWRWSTDIKPTVGTRWCEIHHLQVVLAGRFAVRMEDGHQHVFEANDVVDIPPGHDAWVVGDEPLVILDMSGNSVNFALPATRSRAVVTMLMTDIVGSTALADSIGGAAWGQRLAEHNFIVRQLLEQFGGQEIDTIGDGFLATFGSAQAALLAALAIQERVRAVGLEVRAGVHTGEVELVGDDLRGIEVHRTARIMAEAASGGVLASPVSRAIASEAGLRFTSTGMHHLKGLAEPMELFAVDRDEGG
jgi:class 3 adenylate cyclase